MRLIRLPATFIFFIGLSLSIFASGVIAYRLYYFLLEQVQHGNSSLEHFISVIVVPVFLIGIYVFQILLYRLLIIFFPIKSGPILEKTSQDLIWQMYSIFIVMWILPLLRSNLLPIPFTRTFYQVLGAKVGEGTYFAGWVTDPPMLEIGSTCIVGSYSMIVGHVLESGKLEHYPIKIGNNVTIGVYTTILAGSTIEDGAMIGANSVVLKNSHIKQNEVWGGNPARFIKMRTDESAHI